jgi:1,4-dihydroxy-2-naphthoate octaprenyltransferase
MQTEGRPLSRRQIWTHWLVYPGHTLPTALAPIAVGIGLAIHDHVFAPLPALVGFLASWLIHVGGVFTDNYHLLTRHPDNREHPELIAAVRDRILSLPALRHAALACFAIAALTGPYLVHVGGWPAILFGCIGMASAWMYAGGPWPYARLGLADPVFFLMFGVVAVVGTYYIQAASAIDFGRLGTVPALAFVAGWPVGALVTNVLIIDDIRDRDADEAKGWRTGAVRFGRDWSRAEFVALTIFAYGAPFGLWAAFPLSGWVLLPLLTLPVAVWIAWVVCARRQMTELVPMTPRGAFLSLAYAVLLGAGIAIS